MSTQWDSCWIHARLAPCTADNPFIEKGAIGIKAGQICWIGAEADLPDSPTQLAHTVHSAENRLITPGLIDCHTHLVFAKHRAQEFNLRLHGATYEEIAHQGGGILSTVRATRAADFDDLYTQSKKRLLSMMAQGVTTVEIKSGYGLDLDSELKILRVIQKLAATLPITIQSTFLGAHALPPEFNNKADYIDFVCNTMLPAVAKEKLADAVDVFCEKIAFDLTQTERVFSAAKKYHLKVKLHAEQLSESHSAPLAAAYQALSVDHLEHLRTEESIQALAQAGTVAVLLPGAYYFLRETVLPPIDLLRKHRVPIAIATDCNPGTSPTTSLLLMLNMACTLFRLTPQEALQGVTRFAARALGMEKTHGTLTVGKRADFVLWEVTHPHELAYYFGMPLCHRVVSAGQLLTN